MAAALIPELYVTDFAVSLGFYETLGFRILYARPDDQFAMLERDTVQIMIEQPVGRTFLAQPLSSIRGSGISLQIAVIDVDRLWISLSNDVRIILPIEDHDYAIRDDEVIRVRQFVIADPDGYVLRFSETIA